MNKFFFFYLSSFFLGCVSNVQPKPSAYLRLDYPEANYKKIKDRLNFSFEYNTIAQMNVKRISSPSLLYPNMKATLYLNYISINNNLDSLLNDAYQIPYKHISKAESIPEKVFINSENRVYGTLFSVVGDAASQHQFFLTDSLRNFLVGSLYFYARPNYDSIYPAVTYLKKDIIHLIETLKWR